MDRVRSEMAGREAGHFFARLPILCADRTAAIEEPNESTGGYFRQAERARSAHFEFEFIHLNANLVVPRRSVLILLMKRPLRRSGMRELSMIAAALVLTCGAAFAQTTTGMPGVATTTPPALGMTSPLGTFGGSTPTGNTPTGLPLGATQINPGGVSTTPGRSGGLAGTGSPGLAGITGMSSATGMGSTFDGGGLATDGSTGSSGAAGSTGAMGTTGATFGCTTSTGPSSNGTASPLSNPGSVSSPLNGGTIPLGATELNGGGVSPFVTVPAPTTTTTTTPGTITTPGMTAPGTTAGP